MQYLPQLLFVFFALLAGFWFTRRMLVIRSLVLLGQETLPNDQPAQRWGNLILLALGQKKMFRNVPVAIMHLIIYAGFVIINLEVAEIVLDGITGEHRIFLPLLGKVYPWLINTFEILAAGVILVCVVFLIRRNITKVKRLIHGDLQGWPASDANYILVAEIVLMSLFLTMNAADQLLQQTGNAHYPITGEFWVSKQIIPLLSGGSEQSWMMIERTCWWLHILGIFAFLNYLPYSKHLHILLAFPNAYYAPLTTSGKFTNMKVVQQEVLYAMQPELAPANAAPPEHFGAKDISALSKKSLLDAFSCTECGRCTAACPANLTGKKLSPRKIMMATRDRMEEMGKQLNAKGEWTPDGKSLLHDYITVEELRACTTCMACVEECPVSISPLDIITELRRSLIMEESNAPQEWNNTFSNIENNFAPWKFSPDSRDAWVQES
jgi:ferredoxin